MGWIHESETHLHEAALVPVFEDGAEGQGSTIVDGVDHQIVEFGGDRDDDRRRPSAEIVGWVLRCTCYLRDSAAAASSWTDPVQWARVPSASLEDFGRRRVFAADTEIEDVVERAEVAAAAQAVWHRDHIDLLTVDGELRAAAAARRDADLALDAAVAKARRLGRSWAEIGTAVGMTRQSANERWRNQ